MIGAIYLSAKQNEWHGLLPPLAVLLGIFILDLLAALGTAVLMGYVLPPLYCPAIHYSHFTPLHSRNRCRIFSFASWNGHLHIDGESRDGCGASAHTRRQRILHTTS